MENVVLMEIQKLVIFEIGVRLDFVTRLGGQILHASTMDTGLSVAVLMYSRGISWNHSICMEEQLTFLTCTLGNLALIQSPPSSKDDKAMHLIRF